VEQVRLPWVAMMKQLTGTDVSSLEVAIMDLIEDLPEGESSDKGLLEELRHCLAHHRRKNGVTKGEILFIGI
jgi:hypothetical protein